MTESIFLLTPEDKNFISHVCRNLQTFTMWVNDSGHPEAFELQEARHTSADYLLSNILEKDHLELTDKAAAVHRLATGSFAKKKIDIVAVIKEVAQLLDTYAASLSWVSAGQNAFRLDNSLEIE